VFVTAALVIPASAGVLVCARNGMAASVKIKMAARNFISAVFMFIDFVFYLFISEMPETAFLDSEIFATANYAHNCRSSERY
jgi:hypothetical protein